MVLPVEILGNLREQPEAAKWRSPPVNSPTKAISFRLGVCESTFFVGRHFLCCQFCLCNSVARIVQHLIARVVTAVFSPVQQQSVKFCEKLCLLKHHRTLNISLKSSVVRMLGDFTQTTLISSTLDAAAKDDSDLYVSGEIVRTVV